MVTHVPFATLNGVWVHGPAAQRADVEVLLDDLPTQGLPFSLQASPGGQALAAEFAEERGMVAAPDVPLMTLTAPPAPRQPPGLRIRELEPSERDLRTCVAAAGFGTDPDAIRSATALFGRMPGYRVYLGEVEGEAVTTALSIATGDGVGIFDVATPPEHRGNGYGAAITARAVLDGFDAGAGFSWLQSSPEGLGVYERLGFVTVENWGLWTSSDVGSTP